MSHIPQYLPDLAQTSSQLQIGDDSVGTILKSTGNGLIKLLLQDLTTLGKLQLAAGVDPDDAVAMSQHSALATRVGALETLLTSDDLNLDEAQEWVDFMKNNATDIAALSTSLNSAIAAVQADVDQNETDSDAAEAALEARATTLEAFETLFKAGLTVTADGADWDVYVDKDLYLNNGALLVGNAQIITAGRELKNIASLDAATDTLVSATSIAYTDDHASKNNMRYKQVLFNSTSAAYFGSVIKQDTYVMSLKVKVNTPFDGNTTLSIGHDGDITFFGDLNAVNMGQAGIYELPIAMKMSADMQPKYTLSGSPTQGDLEIFLKPCS